MGAEKNFEDRVKSWLTEQGIYDLGTAPNEMLIFPPIGYFEKRWGGGMSKRGLPDLHIVVCGINIDVELKSRTGRPDTLQRYMVSQINTSASIALVLYPDGFENFKAIVKGVIMECTSVTLALNALKAAHSSTKCDTLTELEPYQTPMQTTL